MTTDPAPLPRSDRSATIARLARAIRGVEGAGISERTAAPRSPEALLDLPPRSLVEWIADGDGSGVTSLALAAARPGILAAAGDRGEETHGPCVLLDERGTLHPPALAELDFDLARLIVVRSRNPGETAWAAEQALRCPGVLLVLWPVDRLRSHEGRRAKLAVEQGGGLGLLLRPWSARRTACWADLRFLVQPLATARDNGTLAERRWRIQVAYRRGGPPGETFEVRWERAPHRLRVVPPLAAPAVARRAS